MSVKSFVFWLLLVSLVVLAHCQPGEDIRFMDNDDGPWRDNANGLVTEEEPTRRGICNLPAFKGPCKQKLRRFYFNTRTNRCEDFIYGGCNGNANNFASWKDCNERCC